MRQIGSHSTLQLLGRRGLVGEDARLGQQCGQHGGVEVALVEQERPSRPRSP